MSTPEQTEPELIETPPQWLVRKTVQRGYNKRKQLDDDTITVELVYGRSELVTGRDGVHYPRITGESYHVLTGPTAEASITEMARQLNARRYVPSGKTQKTRADGYRQSKKAPNTLHRDFELPEQYR